MAEIKFYSQINMTDRATGHCYGWDKMCFGHSDFYEALECQETFIEDMKRSDMKETLSELKVHVRLVKITTAVTMEVIEQPTMVKGQ